MPCESRQTVYPGDVLTNIESNKLETIVGPGLRRNHDITNSLVATQVGTLIFKSPNTFWVESNQKRYVPKRGDTVVGIVIKKAGDMLKVDIGSSEHASLSLLAFEGATKKQKVDLNVGDAVYAKLLNAYKEMEPELVCIDSYSKAGRLGVLSNEGFVFEVSLRMAHRLLNIENPLLWSLGKKYKYEIAIGMNGKIWLRTVRVSDTLKIRKAIEIAEQKSDENILKTCRKVR